MISAHPSDRLSSQISSSKTLSSEGPSGYDETARGAEEFATASLTILHDLGASLEAGQRALLSRDLNAIQDCTAQQQRLQRALSILWGVKTDGRHNENSRNGASELITFLPFRPDQRQEFLAAAEKVLHLGRVQAALVARAQQSLKMISYLVAGSQANYQPPVHTVTAFIAQPLRQNSEGAACRV